MENILNFLTLALLKSGKVVFDTTPTKKRGICTSTHIAIATNDAEYATKKDLDTRLEIFGLITSTTAKFAKENGLTFDFDSYSTNCINITFESDTEIFSLWFEWERYKKLHDAWLKEGENND